MSLFVLFFVLILIGLPIAVAMGIVPFCYVLLTSVCPVPLLAYKIYDAIDSFSLIAIPLFILGGNLITETGITQRLIVFSNELVGRVRGGLSHVNVVVSTILGGLNGSAVADAAAVGAVLIKPMKAMGMSGSYAAAVTACGGTIAAIIPPSIPFILYAASVPEMSVGALFIGGILPGVLICILMCVAGYLIAWYRGYPRVTDPFSMRKFLKAAWDALPALVLVGFVVLGLRSGVFTPAEAGAVITVFALAFGLLVYRNLTMRQLIKVLHETTVMTGIVFLVIGSAGPFMWVLTRIGAVESFTQSFLNLSNNAVVWWTVVIIFLLIAGMFMDTVANLVILSPIIFSAAKSMGFDPFVSSLAIVIILIIGTVTPPVGVSLFVTAAIAEAPIEKAGIEAIPFLLCEVLVVVIILCFPDLAKFIPRLFGYQV